jgi:hypothetical protein
MAFYQMKTGILDINVPLLINSQADSTLVIYQHSFCQFTMEPKDGWFANRKMALFHAYTVQPIKI